MRITELHTLSKKRQGKLLKNEVKLEAHEEKTAIFLTSYGFTVDIIKPINTPKVHNPDFLINGIIWEAKSPEGKSKNTIERKFHEASCQANNLVLDLRRIKRHKKEAEQDAIKQFAKSKSIKRMLLITKDEKLLDCTK